MKRVAVLALGLLAADSEAAFASAFMPANSRAAVYRSVAPLMAETAAVANSDASLENEFESVKAASTVALEVATVGEEMGLAKRTRKRDRVVGAWRKTKTLVGIGKELKEAADELVGESCDIDEPVVCEDEGKFKEATKQLRGIMAKTLRLSLFGKATDKELGEVIETSGDSMEDGWASRSQGSALKRTLEVWGFLANCGLKVVKAGKTKGSPEDISAAKTTAAEFIRDGRNAAKSQEGRSRSRSRSRSAARPQPQPQPDQEV